MKVILSMRVFILGIISAKSPASGANSKTKAAAFNADEKDEDNAKEREDNS